MEDEQIVQNETVSEGIESSGVASEGTTSGENVSSEGETTQPLSNVKEEVDKAVTQVSERYRRELQSVRDSTGAEVGRALERAKLAEGTLASMESGFKDIDPEVAESVKMKARLASYEQQERARQADQYRNTLTNSLTQHLTSLGINPNDSRVDWAEDATNFLQGRSRFDKSVALILKAEKAVFEETVKKQKKEAEIESNKEANSVETSASGGSRNPKRQEIIRRYVEGDPTISTADYEKVMKQK